MSHAFFLTSPLLVDCRPLCCCYRTNSVGVSTREIFFDFWWQRTDERFDDVSSISIEKFHKSDHLTFWQKGNKLRKVEIESSRITNWVNIVSHSKSSDLNEKKRSNHNNRKRFLMSERSWRGIKMRETFTIRWKVIKSWNSLSVIKRRLSAERWSGDNAANHVNDLNGKSEKSLNVYVLSSDYDYAKKSQRFCWQIFVAFHLIK